MHPFIISDTKTSFQSEASEQLTALLDQRKSVELIGMKRVGINTFLRQYLERKAPKPNEISLLIDLNNLAERSLYAFWILTLKTLLDELHATRYPHSLRTESSELFTQSIQLHDLFFTLHAVQRVLQHLTRLGYTVQLFFLRFDRLTEVMTREFYANLKGLKDATPNLTYVVTSYRPLYELLPSVFPRDSVKGFFTEQYILPLGDEDQKTLLKRLCESYRVTWSKKLEESLLPLCGGHVQYLHLAVLTLKHQSHLLEDSTTLVKALESDESIQFLTEEIFASLTAVEQRLLKSKPLVGSQDYLFLAGVIKKGQLFSPLFLNGIKNLQKRKKTQEFTKKEQLFFDALSANLNEVVEREHIIQSVWTEESDFGVSDWAVDRLAARVRHKLRLHHSDLHLQTVVSRGYKLISAEPALAGDDESSRPEK